MTIITDEFMRQMQEKTKEYCVCILKTTPKRGQTGANQFVTEHNRYMLVLRVKGVLAIMFPISDGGPAGGVHIFNTGAEEVKKIMDEDPAVRAGIFTYELHLSRSFPGDALPG